MNRMWSVVLLFSYLTVIHARKIFIAAPNTLHLDTNERVAVVAHGIQNNEELDVYLQDLPKRTKIISSSKISVLNGRPNFAHIYFTAEDLPDIDLTDPKSKVYVALVVKGQNFHEELSIPVDYSVGYVFIQTDKPIYNPQQDVQIRIIPLNEKLLPKNTDVRIKIKNPQDIVVFESTFSEPWKKLIHPVQFPTLNFKFPPYPLLGEWSVEALYGHNLEQNSTVSFVVEEYVLPTFSVTLEVPNVVLPQHKNIEILAKADYVFGKKVDGSAIFKISIKNEMGNVIEIGLTKTLPVNQGEAKLLFNIDEISKHPEVNQFPQGSRLIVEVSVVDEATGNKEIAIDDHCEFSNSPYLISFKNSLNDFKPGLISAIIADVTYVNGAPAANVPTTIKVEDSKNNLLNVDKLDSISDKTGHVLYHINIPIGLEFITVTVSTNDPKYEQHQQFSAKHVLHPAASKGYIAISRTESIRKLEVGEKFTATVFSYPAEKFNDIFFLVMAQGKIIHINAVPQGRLLQRQLEFPITADMAPVLRIVVFSLYENELVADSLRIFVENKCAPLAEVKIKSNSETKEPGSDETFILEGDPDTKVGILAVDNAVYALRNKDRLTKEKLFKSLASRDLGCGPGGGRSLASVLSNAGLVIFGNFNPQNKDIVEPACVEKKRKKREAIHEMVNKHEEENKACCYVGTLWDKHRRTCEERAEILKNFLLEKEKNISCVDSFLECCLKMIPPAIMVFENKVFTGGEIHPGELDRAIGQNANELHFVDESDEENFEKTLVRRDFRETWLFKDYIIGPDGTAEVITSLPHSITTWVIQAVSVSDQWGLCISEPKEIKSFKNIFLHLNVPYSVIRNEQVEIQATVFNYNSQRAPVTVFMYGAEHLCTGVQPGEKSERKKIWVEAHSAGNVGFPVVPLKDQEFSLHVVALSPIGSDVIIKKLNVVPEGALEEEDFVITLDPTNQQNRKKRNVITENYSDSIDDSQQLQVTAVKLRPSKDFIPGTESCVISAIGTEFGPTVETVLQDPQTLIRMPVGCGEQTMMFMGPTLYTLNFLKVKGEITAELEGKIYNFVREGYKRELTFRKSDGSYAAWTNRPSSVWLTAFVMKIFCQASKFIFIDENVICSGINWLISKQNPDGSFEDDHPVIHRDMMGGNNGKIPMTAFVLIALHECSCEAQNLNIARLNAELFLEINYPNINDAYTMAMVAYALSISSSKLKVDVNERLRKMSVFDEDLNQRHWEKESKSHSIETASYALLTQIELSDLSYSLPIINWLNNQRLVGGSYPSTQDTVIALQALSQYSIKSQTPDLSLECNVSSSNDRKLSKVMKFQNDNALVLQQFEVNKIGGTLFFHTSGKGVGFLSVKMRYNVPHSLERLCKFEISVNVTAAVEKPKPPPVGDVQEEVFDDFDEAADKLGIDKNMLNKKDLNNFEVFIKEKIVRRKKRAIGNDYDYDDDNDYDIGDDDRGRVGENAENGHLERSNSRVMLEVNICTKYLSNKDSEMTIIDAGIFSGFKPLKEDLDELVNNTKNPVDRYEIAGRGIIFYLDHVTHEAPVCVKFRIKRDFIVGNVQASVIKVYDYYNNDEACTKFYSPDDNSPLLRTICEGPVCQCAEGGCPPQKPFMEVSKLVVPVKQRQKLLWIACEQYNYVWLGKIKSLEKLYGFLFIEFTVSEVLKAGIEPKDQLERSDRRLMMRDACKASHLFVDHQYLIMGNDGERFEDKITKKLSYRYLIDKTSKVQRYTTFIKDADDKPLQKAMIWLRKELLKNGCNM